jgi:hypothetical protein
MSDDLVKRLWLYDCEGLTREAAARIEELEAKLAKAVEETLDAASAYMKTQYGIEALSHPVDRQRVVASLQGDKT